MKKLVMALMSVMVVVSGLNAQEFNNESRHPDQKLEDIKGNICEVSGDGVEKIKINVLTADRAQPMYIGPQLAYYTDTLIDRGDVSYLVYVVEYAETGEKFLNIEKVIKDSYWYTSVMIANGYHHNFVSMYDRTTGIEISCNPSVWK